MIKTLNQTYRDHNQTVLAWLWVCKMTKCVSKDIAVYIGKILYNVTIDLKRTAYLVANEPCVYSGGWWSNLSGTHMFGACHKCYKYLCKGYKCKFVTIVDCYKHRFVRTLAYCLIEGNLIVIDVYPFIDLVSHVTPQNTVCITTQSGYARMFRRNEMKDKLVG